MVLPSSIADRIVAVALGLCSAAAYLLTNPFLFLADSVATFLAVVPTTLLLYGVTGLPRRKAVVVGGSAALGLALGTYLQTVGVLG